MRVAEQYVRTPTHTASCATRSSKLRRPLGGRFTASGRCGRPYPGEVARPAFQHVPRRRMDEWHAPSAEPRRLPGPDGQDDRPVVAESLRRLAVLLASVLRVGAECVDAGRHSEFWTWLWRRLVSRRAGCVARLPPGRWCGRALSWRGAGARRTLCTMRGVQDGRTNRLDKGNRVLARKRWDDQAEPP